MPNPNERPPGFGFPVDRFDSRTLADILSGKPKPPKLHLRDMTPAQIHAAYGDEIASYIVELRSNVGVWKRIATDRIRSTPLTVPAAPANSPEVSSELVVTAAPQEAARDE